MELSERKPGRTHCEDPRSPPPGMLQAHTALRSEHGLWAKSDDDHVGDARASWQLAFTNSWGPELDGCTKKPEFNTNASYTRWLAPTLSPVRVEDRKGGCRNAWQQQAWVEEARASWRQKNPKDSWHSSAEPLPRLAPKQIQESGRPIPDADTFALECCSPPLSSAAKLMALCILLSSVFLLNTKGVLSEGLFNSLSLVCNLAEHVEESGQEASKPALVWLLRDFVLDLRDESGQDISSDEYLEKSLHAAVPGNHGGRSAGAKEVRDCLLRFFPERKCSTLVMPLVDEDQLRRLSEIPYDTLRPEFRRGFEQVQASIMSMAKARPKTIGGQAVGASGLAALLRRMVEALNSNQMLNMTNAWELVQHNACEALSDELRENALELLRRVREGDPLPGHGGRPLPVRDDVLLEALKEGRKAFRTEWRSRSLGDEAVKEEYWQELKAAIRDQELLLVQLNCKLAEEQLREAGDAWEAWLLQEEEAVAGDPRSEALSLLVDQGMPSRPTARALREALGTCRMARVRWDGEKHAQEVQMKLLRSEVDAQSEAALNASRVEDDAVENTREMAKLKAQVTELTRQMNENMQREKGLREQLCEAEEKLHREVQAQNVEQRRNLELQSQVRDLESQVERLGQDLRDAEDDDRTGGKGKTAGSNPRCGCAVM